MNWIVKKINIYSCRFYEFDWIRVFACITIIATHLWYFCPLEPGLRSQFSLLGSCGLAIFFFLSGFFVAKYPIDTPKRIISFGKGRLGRLLPPFWVAIFCYVGIEYLHFGSPDWQIPLNFWSVLANVLCLQVFFYPLRFFAIWYVSVLLLLYLIYICLRWSAQDNILNYSLLSVIFFFFILYISNIHLSIYGFGFENRLITFYFIFILGSVTGMIMTRENPYEMVFPLIFFTVFSGVLVIQKIFYPFTGGNYLFDLDRFSILTIGSLILFALSMKIGIYKPAQSIPWVIQGASYATYSAYLLHYSVLSLLAKIGINNVAVFFISSIVVVFLVGYSVQTIIDRYVKIPK